MPCRFLRNSCGEVFGLQHALVEARLLPADVLTLPVWQMHPATDGDRLLRLQAMDGFAGDAPHGGHSRAIQNQLKYVRCFQAGRLLPFWTVDLGCAGRGQDVAVTTALSRRGSQMCKTNILPCTHAQSFLPGIHTMASKSQSLEPKPCARSLPAGAALGSAGKSPELLPPAIAAQLYLESVGSYK